MKLTAREKHLVAKELTERCRDLWLSHAYKRCYDILERAITQGDLLKEKDGTKLDINYTIRFVIGDVIQIASRIRRKARGK